MPTAPPFRPLLIIALLAGAGFQASAQQALTASQPPAARGETVTAAVAEASQRFGVPQSWIRAVMRVESGGDASIVSPKGAIGLMQVMPKTYAELRLQYGLGPDPFLARDNILAGTAYLRTMFDRYGVIGMAGAYNAGPKRWEEHLAGARSLPAETIAYLAKLGPALGFGKINGVNVAKVLLKSPSSEAPIFFALDASSAWARQLSDRQRIAAIITVNPTVTPLFGGLFADRSAMPKLQRNSGSFAASISGLDTLGAANGGGTFVPASPLKQLFIVRTHLGSAQ